MLKYPSILMHRVRLLLLDYKNLSTPRPTKPVYNPGRQLYSDQQTRDWARQGCTSAGIGCLECKQPVIDAVIAEQDQIIARAAPYEENPDMVRSLLIEGAEKAEDDARQTLIEVRQAMGLSYR